MSFEGAYAGTPPWDIGRPQPALEALAAAGELRGRVLDAGCGTGEHALMAAALGLDATGIDAAPTAIAKAKEKARERGLEARFVVGDLTGTPEHGDRFDTALDCGCFHVFDDEDRRAYVVYLHEAIVPGGRFFLLCFSDRAPGGFGPRRITEAEIREAFADGWRVDAIEPSILETTLNVRPNVEAWLASITRI
ncbi:MAG TPA: class I SAM-dependent methyltransferase [Actinomycetota bacterium]|nr:class I SAM-dependent methyltransferase [Actinomycetota bacterium]